MTSGRKISTTGGKKAANTERGGGSVPAEPYFSHECATLFRGDCIEVMRSLPDDTFDTIITDPPYHLTQASRGGAPRKRGTGPFGRHGVGEKGFMGRSWDGGGVAFNVGIWKEALRVARPGAYLLSFGGTRTFHRVACAIEDAGWTIRDCIMWLYGNGMPKTYNMSKGIDRKLGAKRKPVEGTGSPEAVLWEGWNVNLKPAWEPVIVAMKPRDGPYAESVLKWGVGGLWIDGARVGYGAGRWPANLLLSHDPRCVRVGTTKVRNLSGSVTGNEPSLPGKHVYGKYKNRGAWQRHGGARGIEEVELWACVPACPVRVLDQQSEVTRSGRPRRRRQSYGGESAPDKRHVEQGSASRFFYCSRASKRERNEDLPEGLTNTHPTLKPVELMCYLCRLTRTPTGGTVLDPFMGSGSTGVAALLEGRSFVGIDDDGEPGSCETARHRVEHALGLMDGDRRSKSARA